MRSGKARWFWRSGVVFTGLATLSLTRGQERTSVEKPTLTGQEASITTSAITTNATQPGKVSHDLSKYSPLQKQMFLSAQRGAEWLFRVNRSDGHFVYGYLPSLRKVLEGDHYLRQAGAAFALARAARFMKDERQTARARQAVLTLLTETSIDPKNPGQRYTTLPSVVVNRLAAAGLLVLAINELPNPAEDLLEQSEQLCRFIASRQKADGSLSYLDSDEDGKSFPDGIEGINYYPGEALYGLMRSHQYRPAPWKTDVLRKAVQFYSAWWRTHKNMAFVPWQSAAFAEAFLLTKDPVFADFVNEMSDWICNLQYAFDPRYPLWVGGFKSWIDDKPSSTPPQVSSASYAEGLAAACRVARQAGDLAHHRKYHETLERCLQFLTTLQYTDSNTQHFADWYRPDLVGGFYGSHQDGNLRIDYTQHAICAMVEYLNFCPPE